MLAPILVFVALEITMQAFVACPSRHAPAVAFALFPTLARLLSLKLGTLVPPERFQALLATPGKELPELLATVALGNGFILTAVLWGGFLAEMIDSRLRASAAYLALLAGLTFFGVVHSVMPDGNMYLPWTLVAPLSRSMVYQLSCAYGLTAVLVLLLSRTSAGHGAEVALAARPECGLN